MHGTSSALEDQLPCPPQTLQGEVPGPPAQPLDDLCPLQEVSHWAGSGCVAQVRPVGSEPCSEESRLNGLNSQAWCNPVIGQPEAKPYPSRIMRLLSNQKRCGDAASERTPNHGPTTTPQNWSGLSGLKVMGSFKKLRSTVFQGIQSRGNAMTANQDEDHTMIANDDAVCVDISRGQQPQQRCKEGYRVNGVCVGESIVGICSGVSDDDEDEDGNDERLQRNSHFSRSIRRAYGSGRISLLDMGYTPRSPKAAAPSPSRRPRPVSTVFAGSEEHLPREANGRALSQMSKSAENLHLFKAPFKRKTASAHLAHPPQRELETEPEPEPDTPERGRTLNINRTTSASSVDSHERASGRWRSPSRTRAQMHRLVGSLTDLTSRRPPIAPLAPQAPLSPLSRLHDDYSRRTPCLPPSDRQRRPSPARVKATSDMEGGQRVTAVTLEHTPSIHPVPLCSLHPMEVGDKHNAELHNLSLLLANQCVVPLTSSPRSGARAPRDKSTGNCGPVEDQRPGTVSLLQPCPQSVPDQSEDPLQEQSRVRHYYTY